MGVSTRHLLRQYTLGSTHAVCTPRAPLPVNSPDQNFDSVDAMLTLPAARNAISMARTVIDDFMITSDGSFEHEESLREQLCHLTHVVSPDGLASVALARFSDESNDSLAARGAVFLGSADSYDNIIAMMAVKSEPDRIENFQLMKQYIMLLLLTDVDVTFINKLWPNITGNEQTWCQSHATELHDLLEIQNTLRTSTQSSVPCIQFHHQRRHYAPRTIATTPLHEQFSQTHNSPP